MNTTLTVDDPLAEQEVTIVITLPAGESLRDERQSLVSLGVAGRLPVIKTGAFADVHTLINEAWTAFGVQMQMAAATAPSAGQETEVVAEEEIVATVTTDADEPAQPKHTAPRPQAKNLSLF